MILWQLARLGVVLLLALAWSAPAALAAVPAAPSIVVILPQDNIRFQLIHAAFLKHLEHSTTAEGKPTLALLTPAADLPSLRNSVHRAMAMGADLTVVYGTRTATAAKFENFHRPLIFADVFDPVTMGLVPGRDRGGEFMTGVCGHAPIQTLLKALQETLGASRLAIPVEAGCVAATIQADALRKVACRRDVDAGDDAPLPATPLCWLEIVPMDMPAPGDLTIALRSMTSRFDAIYLGDLLPTDRHAAAIFDYAAQSGLPVISPLTGSAEQGALFSLEADPDEQGELLADIAGRLLAGVNPEEIAPVMPRRVALVVNLKVARQLGIEVPFSLLLQTKRLIR